MEKMTPKGEAMESKNANFSTTELRAEPALFFIYIVLVYEA